jgi:hypothetical protein
MNASAQFQDEIERVVDRWVNESDLTVAEALGALEVIKWRILQSSLDKTEPE